MYYHLFIKAPNKGPEARSMSKVLVDLILYGDKLLDEGKISSYEIMQSDSTQWQEAWVKGTSVYEKRFKFTRLSEV